MKIEKIQYFNIGIGGTNLIIDKKNLSDGAHIVVGTPGRVI